MTEEKMSYELLQYLDKRFGNLDDKLDDVDNRLVIVETDLKHIRNGKSKKSNKHNFDVKLDLTKVFYFLIAGLLAIVGIKIVF